MYKVLSTFKEKHHNGHIYNEDGNYPAEGFKADPKRVEFLQSVHPEYKVKFLGEEIKPVDPAKKEVKATPKPKSAAPKKTGDDVE